ncbi:MAG TPA: hypothetical protein VNF69_10845 [Burkholderiales bacterium]|nr:hypothetical protein [Burkholderiales bacterium]
MANAKLIATIPRPVPELSGLMNRASDWRVPSVMAKISAAASTGRSKRRFSGCIALSPQVVGRASQESALASGERALRLC